jgi:2-keto-3-deoxy-L-rhamnonate aldolase RhmA
LLVSLAAEIGFEAVWIESEHGPIGFEQAETLCLAAEAGGIFPLIRLPDGERHHVLRALEIGARIILVPMVDNADYARRIVDVGKYPPLGHRGFNIRTRGMGFGMHDLQDVLARANNRSHLFAQIETTAAVEHIDEILAVEGLSGIFMGPGDLAVSMGRAGQMADPELREIVLGCMAKAKAANKLTGIFTLPGPLLCAAMAAGCDLVVCGGDVMDLGATWSKLLAEIPRI